MRMGTTAVVLSATCLLSLQTKQVPAAACAASHRMVRRWPRQILPYKWHFIVLAVISCFFSLTTSEPTADRVQLLSSYMLQCAGVPRAIYFSAFITPPSRQISSTTTCPCIRCQIILPTQQLPSS